MSKWGVMVDGIAVRDDSGYTSYFYIKGRSFTVEDGKLIVRDRLGRSVSVIDGVKVLESCSLVDEELGGFNLDDDW